MNNNWIVVVCVALVSLFNILFAAPTATSSLQEDDGIIEYYDQRQNGTENIRIDLNGFAIVVSPLEALLTAATLFEPLFQDSSDDGIDFFRKQNKQNLTDLKISTNERPVAIKNNGNNIHTSTETSSRKKGSKLQIGNIIAPFLRRKHQEE